MGEEVVGLGKVKANLNAAGVLVVGMAVLFQTALLIGRDTLQAFVLRAAPPAPDSLHTTGVEGLHKLWVAEQVLGGIPWVKEPEALQFSRPAAGGGAMSTTHGSRVSPKAAWMYCGVAADAHAHNGSSALHVTAALLCTMASLQAPILKATRAPTTPSSPAPAPGSRSGRA